MSDNNSHVGAYIQKYIAAHKKAANASPKMDAYLKNISDLNLGFLTYGNSAGWGQFVHFVDKQIRGGNSFNEIAISRFANDARYFPIGNKSRMTGIYQVPNIAGFTRADGTGTGTIGPKWTLSPYDYKTLFDG